MAKFSFIVGLAAGYVLGARAGRAQYERIRATANKVMETPAVKRAVDSASAKAREVTRSVGSDVTDKVAGLVKAKVFGEPQPPASRPPLS